MSNQRGKVVHGAGLQRPASKSESARRAAHHRPFDGCGSTANGPITPVM
jgi:hypothetical protein